MKLKWSTMVLFVMAICATILLAGCGKQQSTGSREAVHIKAAIIGAGTSKETDAATKIFSQAHIDDPTIVIDPLYIPVASGWSDFFTKIQTMVAGGNSPDIAMVAIEGINMFVDMGMALPMDPYFAKHPDAKKEAMSDIHPKVEAPFIISGKTYALVCEWNNVVMHFNTKLLQDAGLDIPRDGWNKEDLLQYCKALTKNADGKKQYALAIPNYYFAAEAWLYNNNASILNDNMTKCTLNEANSVEMFQLWQDMVNKYKYAPYPAKGTDAIQQLYTGKVAMGSWGRWPTQNYKDNNFSDVAIQYLPTFKSSNVIFGSAGFVTVKGTKHPNEAMAAATWCAGKYFIKNYYGAGSIPTRKSVADEVIPALGIPKNFDLYYKSADLARAVQAPIQYASIAVVFDKYMDIVLSNQMPAQKAMDNATKEIDDILAQK